MRKQWGTTGASLRVPAPETPSQIRNQGSLKVYAIKMLPFLFRKKKQSVGSVVVFLRVRVSCSIQNSVK